MLQRVTCFVCVIVVIGVECRHYVDVKPLELLANRYEMDADFWIEQAQKSLYAKISTPLNTKVAKNIILFMGDGMSLATLAATRVYLGNKHGRTGEELKLSFEAFPFTGLAKTYCVDQNVADSACSGNAYLNGVKANGGTVGVSGAVRRGDCAGQSLPENQVSGLMDWAQRAGKKTGIVTTTRVTHASPAAAYAHAAERRWESDADQPARARRCDDIAKQLVRGPTGRRIDIILGGGRKKFLPVDSEGYRSDNQNLVDEWLSTKRLRGSRPSYVTSRQQLMSLESQDCDSVLGLFAPEHMAYRVDAGAEEPSLSEMTLKAIQMLDFNSTGFFLFVEGGRIDTAHHETKAHKALDETVELAKAVETALGMVDLGDTLLLVTSDHSHTMTYSGYSRRGSDILGTATKGRTLDSLPYTTLSYANGPGYRPSTAGQRHDLNEDDLTDANYTFPSLVPMAREAHGGEDVAVFAAGPWAHLFTGTFEQNYIPHAAAFAACLGPGLSACAGDRRNYFYDVFV